MDSDVWRVAMVHVNSDCESKKEGKKKKKVAMIP